MSSAIIPDWIASMDWESFGMTSPSKDDRCQVLFICTGNSCRSQMAEAMLNHLAPQRFMAFSAGSHPAGYVHPLAVEVLGRMGIEAPDARSKGWDEFADVPMDVIITVCDHAAAEPCPVWPGRPATAHWSIPDPSAAWGAPEERLAYARQVGDFIRRHVEQLIALPPDRRTPEALAAIHEEISL